MCSYNKFPECWGGKAHIWTLAENENLLEPAVYICLPCGAQVHLPQTILLDLSKIETVVVRPLGPNETEEQVLAHTC